jgi:hypothetical protein
VQFRDGAQARLNGVGELRFVAGHTVDVHDRGGQERNVLAEVKRKGGRFRGGFGSHEASLVRSWCLPVDRLGQ